MQTKKMWVYQVNAIIVAFCCLWPDKETKSATFKLASVDRLVPATKKAKPVNQK